jgi:acyl-CoA thioester hydrolase
MGEAAQWLAGFPVCIEQAVAWGEMDAFGHVNNVVYFRYCENGRIAYIRRLDWFTHMQATNVGPIIASANLRFRRAVRYPDTLLVAVRATQIDQDRFTLLHRIVSTAQDCIAAEGEAVVVSYDYAQQQKTPLPEVIRQALERLEATSTGQQPG